MRMWMINPKFLCVKHLIAEHHEMHMFVGCINKGKSIKGYIANGLVEVHNIGKRHDNLVIEMTRRRMVHKSRLPEIDLSRFALPVGVVQSYKNMKDLSSRCVRCNDLMKVDPDPDEEYDRRREERAINGD